MQTTDKTSWTSRSPGLPDTLTRKPEGLFISRTRITIYDVMDYLLGGWPPHLIREEFNLTEAQITDVMEYIDTHRTQCVAEYHEVLQQADENHQYGETRNLDHLAQIVASQIPPGQETLREKLQALKAKFEHKCL